jgi:hypothetical protein
MIITNVFLQRSKKLFGHCRQSRRDWCLAADKVPWFVLVLDAIVAAKSVAQRHLTMSVTDRY